jgi:hypothetical protein
MRSMIAAALALGLISTARAADEENPFKNSKVGDWVEYKMSAAGFGGKTKMTITANDGKEVAYDVESTISANGKETTAPVQKMKVDLTKPWEPIAAANMKALNLKIDKVADGKEKIKLGDKEYDTKWTKLKATAKINGMDMVSEYKMWFSKDVPVSGLVKMETEIDSPFGLIKSNLELAKSGRGK